MSRRRSAKRGARTEDHATPTVRSAFTFSSRRRRASRHTVVAQRIRAPGYGPGGRVFESRRRYFSSASGGRRSSADRARGLPSPSTRPARRAEGTRVIELSMSPVRIRSALSTLLQHAGRTDSVIPLLNPGTQHGTPGAESDNSSACRIAPCAGRRRWVIDLSCPRYPSR